MQRLRDVGVLPEAARGQEDDAAFAAAIGFTDIVKRPTASASELRAEDYAQGRELLLSKLAEHRPGLVIFTYKKSARALLGEFSGSGFLPGTVLQKSEVFVMPGPYESAATAARTLGTLADRFERSRR